MTANHPFWSLDRLEFVRVGELAIGERLQTLAGDVKWVQQKLPRPGPTPVYNLEVQDKHVYYVGASGVLAHNAGDTCDAVAKLTHRNGVYEVVNQQNISGNTRRAHRASANRGLLEAIESDPNFVRQMGEILGVDDVAAYMRSGRSGLWNPKGTEWHHPIDNPAVMQLLRREVHRHSELQWILHPGPRKLGEILGNFGE